MIMVIALAYRQSVMCNYNVLFDEYNNEIDEEIKLHHLTADINSNKLCSCIYNRQH